jgi:hypothetical protein
LGSLKNRTRNTRCSRTSATRVTVQLVHKQVQHKEKSRNGEFSRSRRCCNAVFTSTNVDDVFVLLGFLSDPKFGGPQVVIGQYFGSQLYTTSVWCFVGVNSQSIYRRSRAGPDSDRTRKASSLHKSVDMRKEETGSKVHHFAGRANIAAVAAVTIANGGDNISIYAPLFATRSGYDIAAIRRRVRSYDFGMAGGGAPTGQHRTIGVPIRRHGEVLSPSCLTLSAFAFFTTPERLACSAQPDRR